MAQNGQRSGPSEEALAAFYRHQMESRQNSHTVSQTAKKDRRAAQDPLARPGVPQPLPPLTGLDFIDRIIYGLQGRTK